MTASQHPDAEHAPLTSPAAAGSGSTGHDKAVDLVALEVARRRDGFSTVTTRQAVTMILDITRAALAAGDVDVAEALGLSEQCIPWECSCSGVGYVHHDDGQPHQATTTKRRFATEWREVSGE